MSGTWFTNHWEVLATKVSLNTLKHPTANFPQYHWQDLSATSSCSCKIYLLLKLGRHALMRKDRTGKDPRTCIYVQVVFHSLSCALSQISSELKPVFPSLRHASIPSTHCQDYYFGKELPIYHYSVNFPLPSTITLECRVLSLAKSSKGMNNVRGLHFQDH